MNFKKMLLVTVLSATGVLLIAPQGATAHGLVNSPTNYSYQTKEGSEINPNISAVDFAEQAYLVKNKIGMDEKSSLNLLTYFGFENLTENELSSEWPDIYKPSVHIFNEETKTLDFQDGVSLINPGGHIFTINQLVGIQSNGKEVVLDKQQESGGSLLFNITYKTQINNYKDYTHFRINVEYYDTLWHVTRKAEASFTIR